MRKVLRKRLPREIKANLFRYVSLFIMIALCMYIVISLVDAAEIIIRGTEQNQKESNLEDGQITVFYPLTDDQTARIENKGVTIEEHFSYDIKMDDGSNLRIFKNREKIDLVVLDKYGVNNSNKSYGTAPGLAAGPNEAVLEKRYCEEHGISVGDLIKIG
ncbi:MAG: ABC transporter permease, partial [Lachnospiraceae bacterium]|nr:ABC transporter permease [Lachnospiraceae bacterium]